MKSNIDSEFVKKLNLTKTDATRATYEYSLRQFVTWLTTFRSDIFSLDQFVKLSAKEIHEILLGYLEHLRGKNLKYSTIMTQFAAIEFILDVSQTTYDKKYIHKFFPGKNKPKGNKPYTLKDIQAMLEAAKNSRDRALLLVMISSGIRSGAIPYLKLGHMEDIENCKRLRIYAGDLEEYDTFITPEASEAIELYLEDRRKSGEKLDENSPLFRKASLSHKLYEYTVLGPIQRATIWSIISRLVRTSGVLNNA